MYIPNQLLQPHMFVDNRKGLISVLTTLGRVAGRTDVQVALGLLGLGTATVMTAGAATGMATGATATAAAASSPYWWLYFGSGTWMAGKGVNEGGDGISKVIKTTGEQLNPKQAQYMADHARRMMELVNEGKKLDLEFLSLSDKQNERLHKTMELAINALGVSAAIAFMTITFAAIAYGFHTGTIQGWWKSAKASAKNMIRSQKKSLRKSSIGKGISKSLGRRLCKSIMKEHATSGVSAKKGKHSPILPIPELVSVAVNIAPTQVLAEAIALTKLSPKSKLAKSISTKRPVALSRAVTTTKNPLIVKIRNSITTTRGASPTSKQTRKAKRLMMSVANAITYFPPANVARFPRRARRTQSLKPKTKTSKSSHSKSRPKSNPGRRLRRNSL